MPQLDFPLEHSGEEEDEIRSQVWGLLTMLYPRNDLVERRTTTVIRFPAWPI